MLLRYPLEHLCSKNGRRRALIRRADAFGRSQRIAARILFEIWRPSARAVPVNGLATMRIFAIVPNQEQNPAATKVGGEFCDSMIARVYSGPLT
jgi:hypothetical protein